MGSGTAVEFRGIRRSFGATHALDGLDLQLKPGELLALLGPSGCGKTTALRLLAGFDSPTAGQVLIGGKDVTGVPAAKRDTGMVFQAYSLFPTMTAAENVAFGLRMREVGAAERAKRAAELLEVVGLGARGAAYPHELSGGQQQRVALARALAVQPSCCCWTSRCRRSTRGCGCSCVTRSAGCSSLRASPRCSSRTTSPRRSRWPTGWPCSTRAAWSRSTRRRSCTPTRPPRSSPSSSA